MQFSRTASYYHLLEHCCIGNALQQTRVAQIDAVTFTSKPERVLIVGEGNGRFLLALLERYPNLEITVVDESAEMLDRAKARLQQAGVDHEKVQFTVADLRSLELSEATFSLIVTHFFFTNFAEADVAQMVEMLSKAAQPDAEWLLGDFVLPEKGWRRLRAKVWSAILYQFFGWTADVPVRSLPEVEPYIEAAGFKLKAMDRFSAQLLRSARYQRKVEW